MSDHDASLLEEAKQKHAESVARMEELSTRIKALPEDPDADEVEFLDKAFDKEKGTAKRWAEAAERTEIILEARKAVKPQAADEKDPKPTNGNLSVNEPLTYRQGGPHRFYQDLFAASGPSGGDGEARARLQRHATEMRVEMRDLTSTAGAGGEFVPPLWLQTQWIELLRASRPTADAVTKFPLPSGTNSINLPRLATGGATAIQASENAAVNEVDPTTGSVTAGVKTIAGQVDMSRQLFEFSNPGLDEVLFRDLARDYATKLDIQVISGSGAAGQALGLRTVSGINAVTFTSGTPTAALLYAKIADAIQRISSGYLTPDTIVMHPRRWGFFLAASDTTGRPLVEAVAGQNQMASGNNAAGQGVVGQLQGMRVILDANLPTNLGAGTNEDLILVFDSKEVYLWEEGAPRQRVFEDVGSGTLTVRLQVYGYFAFMAARYPVGISTIGGTGLVAPTF